MKQFHIRQVWTVRAARELRLVVSGHSGDVTVFGFRRRNARSLYRHES